MQATEYLAMLRAVPTRHGLAAVGNSFLLEAGDRARRLQTRDEIEASGTEMAAKWKEFCALAAEYSEIEIQPQPEAFDGLAHQLLSSRGFPIS